MDRSAVAFSAGARRGGWHRHWLVVVVALGFCPVASAQVAEQFGSIISGIQQSPYCTGQSGGCDAYNITPRTELEMRFAAPEELAALKSTVKEFSATQLAGVGQRMQAMRTGRAGGGASADDGIGGGMYSGYANYSHGSGSRDHTAYEDAADYGGDDFLAGFDRRLNESAVVGLALAYTDKDIRLSSTYVDEDTTTANAIGHAGTHGFGATVYGQWDRGNSWANGSLGNQWLSNDLKRRADYYQPGFSVPLTAKGSPKSTNLQVSLGAGHLWPVGAASFELSANGVYQRARTSSFRETGAVCPVGSDCEGLDLDMKFARQVVKSLEVSATARAQYAVTAGPVVLVPFVDAEAISQLEDGRYSITGMYAELYGLVDNFDLDTDKPDTRYFAASAGTVVVGRNGWQGFLRYRRTIGLAHVSDNVIAAGVRYELP